MLPITPTLQCHLPLEICIAQPVVDANEGPGPSYPPVPMRLRKVTVTGESVLLAVADEDVERA